REYTQDIRSLKGVGPKLSSLLGKININTVADLLLHFPRDYIDRTHLDHLECALGKERVNCIVKVIAHDYIGWGRKKILKVYIEDMTGRGALLCFGRNYLESVLFPGREILVSAAFKFKYNEIQSSNFDLELIDNTTFILPLIPIYPLTEGLSQGYLRKLMKNALELIRNNLTDELPLPLIKKYDFPLKAEALSTIHFPPDMTKLASAKKSLVYEELFYFELIIGRRIQKKKIQRKQRHPIRMSLESKLLKRLPFILTADQKKTILEIKKDLFSPYPMSRLLQGDVGCGKTLVAVICAIAVIESGEQVAFCAPTELLARQHAEHIAFLLEPLGICVAFLSGNVKGEGRKQITSALENGKIDLLIGTHALFSKDIFFKNLGFVIVDEQHRFGVLQRLAIMKKGTHPDLLLMTATPIPRTLALTAFGDLEVSTIKMLPKGRKKIITHLTKTGNEHKVYQRIREQVGSGRQAYFVYPLIEESEKLSLKNAGDMYNKLAQDIYPEFNIGLIHSRLPEEEKRVVMDRFIKNEINILVATSVVEVGVDIPNANCMVIEHAERFGLSALHQLRGRVGRGHHQSYAFLIYSQILTEDGIKRLKVIMETTDGFRISEEDLTIRGPGELLGVKQSGFLKFTIANLQRDMSILEIARKDALDLIEKDPGLLGTDNGVIREVLSKAPPFPEQMLDGG
ncbi:MAG: ATP-dependent DNA helicase RecG, partial [Spirochaetales bacterium]|nr:ATP-dependent DNA helicase RecG [Spirochaetales bacterium]